MMNRNTYKITAPVVLAKYSGIISNHIKTFNSLKTILVTNSVQSFVYDQKSILKNKCLSHYMLGDMVISINSIHQRHNTAAIRLKLSNKVNRHCI